MKLLPLLKLANILFKGLVAAKSIAELNWMELLFKTLNGSFGDSNELLKNDSSKSEVISFEKSFELGESTPSVCSVVWEGVFEAAAAARAVNKLSISLKNNFLLEF